MTQDPSLVRYFKTSPEIIRLAVMMYIGFPLSLRNLEILRHERGVDHEGEVPESFVMTTRDRRAALNFLTTSMKRHGRLVDVVTVRLRTYGTAMKEMGGG